MNARVVVGVDGSPQAHQALVAAVRQATCLGGHVQAVMAYSMPLPLMGFETAMVTLPTQRELRSAAQSTLDAAIAKVVADVRVEAVVVLGPASQVLVDAAQGADLLVVGSRGRGGIASVLLGSVSHHVVSHADCPVLVVRPHSRPDSSRDGTRS